MHGSVHALVLHPEVDHHFGSVGVNMDVIHVIVLETSAAVVAGCPHLSYTAGGNLSMLALIPSLLDLGKGPPLRSCRGAEVRWKFNAA